MHFQLHLISTKLYILYAYFAIQMKQTKKYLIYIYIYFKSVAFIFQYFCEHKIILLLSQLHLKVVSCTNITLY